MPTYGRAESFKRDYKDLDPQKRKLVKDALDDFIADLTSIENGELDDFRPGLRVKPMQNYPGIWEMSWDEDGRATFRYGNPITAGKRHVEWRRIGMHGIFRSP